jgi:hypothetical protein
MEWLSYINEIYREQETVGYDTSPVFNDPVSVEAITDVEMRLGNQFPEELRTLLQATNGVEEWMKTDKWQGAIGYLIWPLELIQKHNLFFRSYEGYRDILEPFDNLLFFADAGNGDSFGFCAIDRDTSETGIYVWHHEDDRRVPIAASLREFIRGWILGNIQI